MDEIERKINAYLERGWCPAKWAHHPQPIKEAIRSIGFRPQIKQCFYNCQKFLVCALDLELEYHEGWIMSVIPIEHAWLKWEGQIVDLTLEPSDNREYLDSITYTRKQVMANMIRTGAYTVIDQRALSRISPFSQIIAEMGNKP